MNILVVIDMQNDFISGVLGSEEAKKILPAVVDKLEHWKGDILFTRDTHQANYLDTQEGKNLPVPHCLEGSEGWEIHPDLTKFITRSPVNKGSFGSMDLVEEIRTLQGNCDETQLTITLLGLCTDICVIANAMILKPAFPEALIQVDSHCCAGVTVESHQNALQAMKMCQISILDV